MMDKILDAGEGLFKTIYNTATEKTLGSVNRYTDGVNALRNGELQNYLKNTYTTPKGYQYSKIAGDTAIGYMGLSAIGRIATGGGLYKDSDGNTDIIGIPFI